MITITKYGKYIAIYVGTEVCRAEIIRFNNILDECKILLPALFKIKNKLCANSGHEI